MISRLKKWSAAAAMAVALMGTAPAQAQGVSVFVDGDRVGFDQPPVIQDGRTLVPLRGVFEEMGATVVWDAGARRVLANHGATQVILPIGSRTAIVNGQTLMLDVPAQIYGGRTLVPLRFVAESLGAEVVWSPGTRTVTIASGAGGDIGGGGGNDNGNANRPEIDSIILSQTSLRLGDTLRVIATGDAGASASFDIMGVRTGVPMTEVSPGRYEGNLNIASGMNANNSTVVVHLMKNGLEDIEQASTTVSFEGTADLITSVDVQPNGPFQLNQQVQVLAYGQAGGYATMNVGGRIGIPMTEISPGTYRGSFVTAQQDANSQVTVNLRTNDGRTDTHVAQETISFTGGAVYLNITSPISGSTTDGNFTLTGQTVPYATVEATVTRSQELIPGIIGIGGDSIRRSVQADANGNFSMAINASSLGGNADDLDISVVARDQYGNTSQAYELELGLQ